MANKATRVGHKKQELYLRLVSHIIFQQTENNTDQFFTGMA